MGHESQLPPRDRDDFDEPQAETQRFTQARRQDVEAPPAAVAHPTGHCPSALCNCQTARAERLVKIWGRR